MAQSDKLAKSDVLALILAPSRELAIQIYKVINEFKDLVPSLSLCYFIGGNKLDSDIQRIKDKGCNVVVGTVGRVFDLHQKNYFSLKKIELLVMDEADKLIEDGNEVQLNDILMALPK